MLVTGRVARAVVAACAVAAFGGCSATDSTPDPTPTRAVDADVLTAALLKPTDIGSTWKEVQPPRPTPLVALCGGGEEPPAVPGAPTVVSRGLVDSGSKGAQALDQAGLLYPDAAAAAAGLAALRVSAEACAASIKVPAQVNDQRREPAYTETLAVKPLSEGEWSGFVVERHKLYDPAHPAAADTAVAVLTMRNVLLVDAYAVYVLGAKAPAPQFDSDWRKLLATTLARVAV